MRARTMPHQHDPARIDPQCRRAAAQEGNGIGHVLRLLLDRNAALEAKNQEMKGVSTTAMKMPKPRSKPRSARLLSR